MGGPVWGHKRFVLPSHPHPPSLRPATKHNPDPETEACTSKISEQLKTCSAAPEIQSAAPCGDRTELDDPDPGGRGDNVMGFFCGTAQIRGRGGDLVQGPWRLFPGGLWWLGWGEIGECRGGGGGVV